MSPFTKKPYNNLAQEIHSEEIHSKNARVIVFILATAIIGISIMTFSHFYGEAHKDEIINLREMNQ